MMRRRVLAWLLLALPGPVMAQTPEQLLTQARDAFENLDFEQAARLYTRLLDVSSGATETQRDTAQLYLGVSYEFAGQRVNAVSALRTFIRSNPCAPTPSQFGGSVTAAFVEAQGGVFAVGVCEIRAQRVARGDAATFRIAATRPAMVRALLQDSTGKTVADFGEQQAAGVSAVRWTAVPDPATFGARPVALSLVIQGRAQQGTETDQRTLSIVVYTPPVDTLPLPVVLPDSALRPERKPAAPILGDLGKGVGVGAATVLASTALAYASLKGETPKALAIGGAISLAGLTAFVVGSGHLGIPGNREYNSLLRQRWSLQRDSIMAVNRARTSARALVIEPVRPQ